MIALILLIVLVIALWTGCILFHKHRNDGGEFVCGLLGGLTSVVLLFAIVGVCALPSDANGFCERRDGCANLVESINDKMTTETINKIVTNAIYINQKILKHREHVNSDFVGVFYSRKVADQELIALPEFTVVNKKEIQ